MLRLSNAIKRSIERRHDERTSSVFVGPDEMVSLADGPDGPDPRLRLTGFGHAEADGVWSEALVASAEFSIRSKDLGAEVELLIEYLPLVVGEHVAEIEMVANDGHALVLSRSGDPAGWRRATAFAVINPAIEINTIRCDFRVRNPVSPRELGLGDDDRLLGLKLAQLSFGRTDGVSTANGDSRPIAADTIAEIEYVAEPVAHVARKPTFIPAPDSSAPGSLPTQSFAMRVARRVLRTPVFVPVQRALRYARSLSAMARSTEASVQVLQRDLLRFTSEFRERLHLLHTDGATSRSNIETSVRGLAESARDTRDSLDQKIDRLTTTLDDVTALQLALPGRLVEFENKFNDSVTEAQRFSAVSQAALSDRVEAFQKLTLARLTAAIEVSSTLQNELSDRINASNQQALDRLRSSIDAQTASLRELLDVGNAAATLQRAFSDRIEALENAAVAAAVRLAESQTDYETLLDSTSHRIERRMLELHHVKAEASQRGEQILAGVENTILQRQEIDELARESIRAETASVRAAVERVSSTLVERTDPLLRRLVLPLVDGWLLRTHSGYMSCPHSEQWLAACLLETGDVELGTRLLIERLLEPGMVFIDVGANIGIHTLPAARRVGPHGHVFAIEPTPDIARHLQSTISLNGLSNIVTVLPVAAGGQAGEATLYFGTASGLNSIYPLGDTQDQSIQVQMVSLDGTFGDRKDVELIKIDVEGAELAVLKGAVGLLAANPHAAIIAEFGPSHLKRVGIEPDAWFDAFSALQFQCYLIDALKGTCSRVTRIRDLFGVYSENLLFVRKGTRIHGMAEASHG